MASNYTCRACLSSILKSGRGLTTVRNHCTVREVDIDTNSEQSRARILPLPTHSTSTRTALRTLSISTPSLYRSTNSLSAKPQSLPESDQVERQIPDVSARLVRGMRKMAPIMTETYAAYGATDSLFKECARHGDYEIPEAKEKGGVIPTNEEGTHIGRGGGWWYDSEWCFL
jgi:cytochrome b pre-mRNA-processing protein 3